jgi:hypothetical protein
MHSFKIRTQLMRAFIVGLFASGALLVWVQTQAQPASDRVVRNTIPKISSLPPSVLEELKVLPPALVERARDEFGARYLTVLRNANFDASKIHFRPRFSLPPRVMFANTEPCYYRNYFFDKNVFAVVQDGGINDPLNQEVGRYGDYYTSQDVSQPGQYLFTANCEDQAGSGTLTVPNPQNFDHPPIIFPNRPPVVSSFNVQVGGQNVIGATRNTTVDLVAVASDPDGDPITFTWGVNGGRLLSTLGSTAKWHLPNAGGTNFAYLLVTDSKGGYREAGVTVSSDAGKVLVPPAPAPVPLPPSAHVRSGDHFLTYFSSKEQENFNGPGADSRMGSCRYYESIKAVDGCGPDGQLIGEKETFAQWKHRWGLDVGNAGVKALYANKRDLFLERDMHGISNAAGTAYVVCNYPFKGDPNFANALTPKNLVACVAMEYSVTPGINGGAAFTKFLVYAPSGHLLQSVNLDGRGEKFIPGSCVVCHGANTDFARIDERGATSPAINAQFLPFDLDNFAFGPQHRLKQPQQETALRNLSRLILNTNPTPAIAEVIAGWYPAPTSTFQGSFVPSGWSGHEPLYRNLVKENCRTCHVAMTPGNNTPFSLAFQSFDQFNHHNFTLSARVCGLDTGVPRNRWAMPNSLVTFDNFWNNSTAVSALETHLQAQGEISNTDHCVPPSY